MAEMRFVQLDEKNEERMNAIRKFTLMDDTACATRSTILPST